VDADVVGSKPISHPIAKKKVPVLQGLFSLLWGGWRAIWRCRCEAGKSHPAAAANEVGALDEINDDEFNFVPGPDKTPEQVVTENEETSELRSVFSNLSTDNRGVLVMLYHGYSKTEIAEAMGISKPAVTQRVQTIAKKLSHLGLNCILA
jgi:RNA polymerase sigma factor (sigma-70 family)